MSVITVANRQQLEEMAGRLGGQVPPAPEPAPAPEVEPTAPAPAAQPVPTAEPGLLEAINRMGQTIVAALQQQRDTPAPDQAGGPAPELLPLLERVSRLDQESPVPADAAPSWHFKIVRDDTGLMRQVVARARGRADQVFQIHRSDAGQIVEITQEASAP